MGYPLTHHRPPLGGAGPHVLLRVLLSCAHSHSSFLKHEGIEYSEVLEAPAKDGVTGLSILERTLQKYLGGEVWHGTSNAEGKAPGAFPGASGASSQGQELQHPILPNPLLCFSWLAHQQLCSPACYHGKNIIKNY